MDVNYSLRRIENIRKEIGLIVNDMNVVTKQYESEMSVLRNRLNDMRNELFILEKDTYFSVKIKDLVDELSNISGVDINDIKLCLETNLRLFKGTTVDELLEFYRNSKESYYIRFSINGFDNISKKLKFDYFGFLPLKLEEIVADDRMLVEHCSLIEKDSLEGKYFEAVIDKNIDDVMLNFNLSYFEMNDGTSWYPSALFKEAVINCVNERNRIKKRSFSLVKREVHR